MQKIDVLGVQLSVVNPQLAYEVILKWVKEQVKVYICVAPASTLVDAQHNQFYKEVINQAAMVTPDGVPVVWLAKAKGCQDIVRTYGPDLMRLVCNKGQDKDLRHFFYGATNHTLIQLQNHLRQDYPKINIVGYYAPPFNPTAVLEKEEVIKLINESRADVLWVGLGSPKQDFWMNKHRPLFNVPVMIGSGAAFDFLSGVKAEAPRWMQTVGLGWLFRLCCEPRRLWKRYLIGNMLFLYYAIVDSMRNKNDSS